MSKAWKLVHDRFDVIREHIRSGAVLDIGCVDARPQKEQSRARIERKPDLLFRRILEANPGTLGVDVDGPGVEALQKAGYRVLQADAETMNLGQQFDTIVAGELIEHLENPGRFLRNMRRHLTPQGVLIVSTPNPFSSTFRWGIWRRGQPQVHEDHTCWFDPITLGQLLRRTGFEVIDGRWVQRPGRIFKTWQRFFRRYFASTFLVVARPSAAGQVSSAA
jgi:SAM-dependent methyltransferase